MCSSDLRPWRPTRTTSTRRRQARATVPQGHARTRVETLPSAVYFSRANKLEFSLMLVGWASDTAEASSPLKAQLATYDVKKGMGTANRGRYSNPKMDALLEQALATVESCDIVLMLLNKASRTDVGTYYGYYGDEGAQ